MKLNPYLSVVIAASLAGLSSTIIKFSELPATSLSFFRLIVPTVLLFLFLKSKRKKFFKKSKKTLLIASTLNGIKILLITTAYILTSIGNGVIILFTWPIFTTIFASIFLKEKVDKRTIALIAMAFIGIIIMYSNKDLSFENNDFMGIGIMLMAAISHALVIVLFKNETKKYTNAEIVFYQNIVGALMFTPFIFINTTPTLIQTGFGLSYGILVGTIGYLLFFHALKDLKVSHYGLLGYWEVPVAILLGIFLFNEGISLNTCIGGGLILGSGLLLKKEPKPSSYISE